MSKLSKKAVSVALSLTVVVWLSGAALVIPQASAATVAELTAQIAQMLASIQALQAQLNAAQGTPGTPSYNFTQNLTLGSKGADVKALQQWLNANGYKVAMSGAGSAGMETMVFGPATKAALMKYQMAKGIMPAAGFFGPKTRAAVAAMGGGTGGNTGGGGGTPPPPASGLTITLAADNAPSASIPKGATAIPFLKIIVSGSGTLDSLVFKRVGAGATGDFDSGGINLYDGMTRLTSGKSLNSTDHTATFVNLALAISGTKTLLLTGNTVGAATAGDVNAFNLISAAGTPTPTGFPVMGNSMVIGGATVGGFAIDNSSAPSNPNIGQLGAKLLTFTITASSSEDINVQKIVFTQGGTVNNDYITNFKLQYADQVLATADKIGAKQLATLNLTTPFKIEKGQVKTFDLYGDIAGAARSSDTVSFYVDNAADVVAQGLLFGYTVLPDIHGINTTGNSITLTLQGAAITMNFIAQIAGDVALRDQDTELFRFNFTSKNNIEIKNFRFAASTTGIASQTTNGFNDFKLWDAVSNTVLTSAVDITATSTNVTFTDVVPVMANQTRTFKITADIDPDNDTGDTIAVKLLAFSGSNDIRNLDNNTYVTASTDITPNANITGNTQTVKSPALDVNLSASPSSKTYVQGTQNVALVGFTFNAVADNIKMTQLKIYATGTTATLTTAELTNLGLYDGDNRLGDFKSLTTGADLTLTFSNFNLLIPKGTTKNLTVKGNIATDATNADVYAVYINALADVTDYDSAGSTVTNTGVTANSGYAVKITIANVGDVTVTANDTASNKAIIIAGQENVLGNYNFTATNEDMTVKTLHIEITSNSDGASTSTDTGDDVPFIRLYDGATPLTNNSSNCVVNGVSYTGCYSVPISGTSSSIVQLSELNWLIPANGQKTLTVKGLVDQIGFNGQNADSGANIYANILATGFKARGQTTDDNSISAAVGQQKIIFRTKPTLSMVPTTVALNGGGTPTEVFNFKVAADPAGTIEWRKVQFYVQMTGATMSAVNYVGQAGTTIALDDVTGQNNSLTLATAYSGNAVASTSVTTASTTGGNSGYVTLQLTTPERIPAGTSKAYRLKLSFLNLIASPGASAGISLTRSETTFVVGTWYANINDQTDTATSGVPSFVWSDYSSSSHATSTGDWTNSPSPFVKSFSDVSQIHN